ncbi:MAG: PxKF domain-containing protein [Pyrinomonadaceae bacterium]|nr:PxKF domain-containing protein [Pyrinomonadaceae bacterium]
MASAFAFSSISSAKLRAAARSAKASPSATAPLNNAARPQAYNPAPPDAFDSSSATVTTDKTDYQPGETVVLSGSGWLVGENVLITLRQEPNVHGDATLSAVADENGDILNKEYATTKDDLGTSYTVTATGQSSGRTASVNFTDGGIFSYNPNTTTLTIQTGPSAASDQFTQNITSPGGNGSFQASPQVVSVPATTPIPASWLSFNPSSRNFSTGPAQNPSADIRSWVVTATVPANSTPGTYVADIQAKPNSASVNVGVGQGTRLTLTVLPPAPVDNTPPTTSLSAQDSNGNAHNGVNFTNANKVTITLSATDLGSPSSGVAETIYKVDNAAPKTYTGPFDIAAEGLSVITYFSRDNAGNQESPSHTFTVRIDKTAPVVVAVRDTAANSNGWNNTDVVASYNASDRLSGLNASSPATGSHVFNTEGAGQSHTFTVTDKAGNSNSASVSNVNIDKTPPVITITTPASNGSYVLNSIVAANFSTSDALSGLDASTQTSTTPQGSNISTAPVGSKSFTVSVSDKAGNPATQTNNYNVTYAPAGGACGGSGHIILQPINVDGSSVFKKGSTVPAKFRVFDANCNSVGTAGVVTGFVLMYVGSASNTLVNEVVDSTTPDTVFRWSPTDQQWIFNINTKNLSVGQKYIYRITLNDSSYIDFAFSLK